MCLPGVIDMMVSKLRLQTQYKCHVFSALGLAAWRAAKAIALSSDGDASSTTEIIPNIRIQQIKYSETQ